MQGDKASYLFLSQFPILSSWDDTINPLRRLDENINKDEGKEGIEDSILFGKIGLWANNMVPKEKLLWNWNMLRIRDGCNIPRPKKYSKDMRQ